MVGPDEVSTRLAITYVPTTDATYLHTQKHTLKERKIQKTTATEKKRMLPSEPVKQTGAHAFYRPTITVQRMFR